MSYECPACNHPEAFKAPHNPDREDFERWRCKKCLCPFDVKDGQRYLVDDEKPFAERQEIMNKLYCKCGHIKNQHYKTDNHKSYPDEGYAFCEYHGCKCKKFQSTELRGNKND